MKEMICTGRRKFIGRRSIRLRDYDYSLPGSYFITMCVKDRKNLFGNIVNGEMRLNQYGRIVQTTWNDIPHHYSGVLLDEFIIMPNHIHGIIIITNESVGAIPAIKMADLRHESPLRMSVKERRRMLLSKIIGRFKMNSSKIINTIQNTPGKTLWQRNYYEHIIRNEKSYHRIQDYIINNPHRWQMNKENPEKKKGDIFDHLLVNQDD